jgi:hypothetical protein
MAAKVIFIRVKDTSLHAWLTKQAKKRGESIGETGERYLDSVRRSCAAFSKKNVAKTTGV